MSRAMKDSGIPWIGEIPKDWKLCRFKNFVRLQTTPSVSNKKIGLENIESETGKYIETESKFEGDGVQFYQGDIVYGKLRPYLRKVWLATFDGNAVGDFFVFKARKGSNSNYVKWLLLSDGYTEAVNSSVYGAKMPRVSSDFILTLPYFLPPLPEQQRIAEFLNMKCGEIDEAIALQEEFIEELKAYKQSVITEAVTRGLNPNAKLKDSGIDWIGKIPQGWETRKIKALSVFINGFAFNSFDFKSEGEMPVIRIGDIATPIIYEHCVKVSAPKELSPFLINRGDILIAMSGATTGKCCFVVDDTIACINQRVGIIRGNKNRFLYYTLQSSLFFEYIMLNSAGSAQPNISAFTIGDYKIAVPNEGEMIEIADYLDNKCTEIDSLIAIKQQKIEGLKDYKKSIIYEYVTGKKEVE